MKKIGLLLILLLISKLYYANSNLVVTALGNGEYEFNLNLDLSNTSYNVLTGITWNFNDGTSSSGLDEVITHTYYSNNEYDVSVTYVTSTSGVLTASVSTTITEIVVVNDVQSITPCPTAMFTDSYWTICSEYNQNWDYCDQSNYWTADSVVWDTGDGNVVSTNGISSLSHIYDLEGAIVIPISGVAYFTGENGETCSTSLLSNENGVVSDPCSPELQSPDLLPIHYAINNFLNFSLFAESIDNTFCNNEPINLYFGLEGLYFQDPNTVAAITDLLNNLSSLDIIIDGQSVSSSPNGSTLNDFFHIWQGQLSEGQHTLEVILLRHDECTYSTSTIIDVQDCDTTECNDCNTFKPKAGETYWLSAWVKEDHNDQQLNYESAFIELGFNVGAPIEFHPTGDIIEGWQRIVGKFVIPAGASEIDISLVNNDPSVICYFDDIRIHPFNASMKSYVYDPETLWLTAELDDNNYATFYEYDMEGQLIRIKKETARGIMTIQESRSSNPKKENE